jgi:uncharacterized protein YceH (UPF0502 family)
VNLDAREIEGCLLRMRPRGLIRQHERDSSRVARFEGLLAKELGLRRQEEAIVAELLLRGPQTAPELARRCSRMATFAGPSEVEALLGGLAQRDLARLLPRESGQRHARWAELLTDGADTLPPNAPPAQPPAQPSAPAAQPLAAPAGSGFEQSEPHAAHVATPVAAPAPGPAPVAAPVRAGPDEVTELRDLVEMLVEDVETLRGEVAGLRSRLDELTGM